MTLQKTKSDIPLTRINWKRIIPNQQWKMSLKLHFLLHGEIKKNNLSTKISGIPKYWCSMGYTFKFCSRLKRCYICCRYIKQQIKVYKNNKLINVIPHDRMLDEKYLVLNDMTVDDEGIFMLLTSTLMKYLSLILIKRDDQIQFWWKV